MQSIRVPPIVDNPEDDNPHDFADYSTRPVAAPASSSALASARPFSASDEPRSLSSSSFFFLGTWRFARDSTKRRIAGRTSRPKEDRHDATSRDRRPTDRELAGPASAPTRDRSWMTRRSSCEFPSRRNPRRARIGWDASGKFREIAKTSRGLSLISDCCSHGDFDLLQF